MPDRRGQVNSLIYQFKAGKRSPRNCLQEMALISAADERSRNLSIIRASLPEPQAERIVAKIISMGVLQVLALQPLDEPIKG